MIPTPVEPKPAAPGRSEPVRRIVAALASGGTAPAGARRLPRAGVVLIGIGIALIGLGWFGASGTAREFEQIPYVLSGGVLGLALVIVGSMLCVVAALRQLGDDMRSAAAPSAAGAAVPVVVPAARVAVPEAGLVVTAAGSLVHRADCTVVAGRAGVRPAPPGAADDPARRCRMCLGHLDNEVD